MDKSEDIEEIVWRVDSKIAEVRRTSNSTKKNLRFDYDAMGNRIAKHIYTDNAFTLLEKSTYYVRDASGNVMAVYDRIIDASVETGEFMLSERHIYGSSRIGMDVSTHVFGLDPYTSLTETTRELGRKQYEISNHLGNVLSVITDQKLPVQEDDIILSYTAVIITATDYSPFGVGLYGRSWSGEYRYGFNGKEVDSEGMGGGSSTYDYGFRIYNAQLGKFLSVDPLFGGYPWYTPYQFAGNKPIVAIDLDGLEEYIVIYYHNAENETTKIRVAWIEDIKTGRPLDLEYHKRDERFKDAANNRVLELHLNEDGTEAQPPVFRNSLTKSEENIKSRRRNVSTTRDVGVNDNSSISATLPRVYGSLESKVFDTGSICTASISLVERLELNFIGGSDNLVSDIEKQKVKGVGEVLQILEDAKVTLTGNTAHESRIPGYRYGRSDEVLDQTGSYEGGMATFRELMLARARVVQEILEKDYDISSDRITLAPGSHSVGAENRNVTSEIKLAE